MDLIVLCLGVGFLYCLSLMYVFIFLVQFGLISGRLLGKSCSFGLRYVFVVKVPISKCHFSFFPPLGLCSGNFFLIAPFPDHCLLVHCYRRIHSLSKTLLSYEKHPSHA